MKSDPSKVHPEQRVKYQYQIGAYNVDRKVWVDLGKLNYSRHDCAVSSTPDGKYLYVFGGSQFKVTKRESYPITMIERQNLQNPSAQLELIKLHNTFKLPKTILHIHMMKSDLKEVLVFGKSFEVSAGNQLKFVSSKETPNISKISMNNDKSFEVATFSDRTTNIKTTPKTHEILQHCKNNNHFQDIVNYKNEIIIATNEKGCVYMNLGT